LIIFYGIVKLNRPGTDDASAIRAVWPAQEVQAGSGSARTPLNEQAL